ncbi:MAG: DNA mismatch repair protein MutS [Candidatus Dependentiae bacterium]|nr:DNA mismatch repair protein MutS [Candidatus Dependentiae bacterium]
MAATPLLQQYFEVKTQFADALVLFQVGDFYELFFDDAKAAAAFLGIALTKRGMHEGRPVPLCGVPIHALDHYLVKLVRGGFRVVLCDQSEPARAGKLVERQVRQVLTPGTLTDMRMLDEKSASYCAAIAPFEGQRGLACIEVLTGQIFVTIAPADDPVMLEAELRRFSPDEILVPASRAGDAVEELARRLSFVTARVDATALARPDFDAWLAGLASTSHELVARSHAVLLALQLLFSYMQKHQPRVLETCAGLFFYVADDYLVLDAATQRNLEITKNLADGSTQQTLFAVLDGAVTPMGSRMIKKWLVRPLVRRAQIEARHEAIGQLHRDFRLHEELSGLLRDVGDVERVVGRIVLRRAQLHDYQQLAHGLEHIDRVRSFLAPYARQGLLARLSEAIVDFEPLRQFLGSAINLQPECEGAIALGFSVELDRVRQLAHEGTAAIAQFEQEERARTGISSLKVKYNRVQGYAIEVTKANLDAAPSEYLRIQTLATAERFTVQRLKDLEYELVRAERQMAEIEEQLFAQVRIDVEQWAVPLRRAAHALAQLDALVGLTRAAYEHGLVCPVMSDATDAERKLVIADGRHPVVAAALGSDFVANGTQLDAARQTWIITGPNMGGKSTYLRQVALISLMAQAGSWVPASSALLPIFDRIFTRIGASDNVAAGKSTFLVEMEETALICKYATAQSLVILDEVGRGTSTYDGLAIAQAVLEYLHTTVRPFALFATHYHELTALARADSGLVAYHAASQWTETGIILLHKIVPGCADGSFGIEVARQVDLPATVLDRAQRLVEQFGAK